MESLTTHLSLSPHSLFVNSAVVALPLPRCLQSQELLEFLYHTVFE